MSEINCAQPHRFLHTQQILPFGALRRVRFNISKSRVQPFSIPIYGQKSQGHQFQSSNSNSRLLQHPTLKLNTRFAGLFQQGKRRNPTRALVEDVGCDKEQDDNQVVHASHRCDDQRVQPVIAAILTPIPSQSNTIPPLRLPTPSYQSMPSRSTTNPQVNYYYPTSSIHSTE